MQNFLNNIDPEINFLIEQENLRQRSEINLIASENYVHPGILEAAGSVLTNKYAEGYPGKRYYGGCQYIDQVEQLAISRAKKLFGAEHANVQPHSGSQANMAVYTAILKPGDTIMGMSLAAGGHLTHGHNVNFSGNLYNVISYGVDPVTQEINYQEIEMLAHKHKPKLIIAGASSYSKFIDFEKFGSIARDIGAYFMADIAHIAGLIAVGLHPSPIEHADFVTSTTHKTLRGPRGGLILCKEKYKDQLDKAIIPGIQGGPFMHIIAAKATAFKLAQDPEFKIYQQQILDNAKAMVNIFKTLSYKIVADGTDNHLFVLDLRSKNITGKQAETILENSGIIVNRNCIPFDPEKPWITSGIRIGTPAVTSRGFKMSDCEKIAYLINDVIINPNSTEKHNFIKTEIAKSLAFTQL